MTQRQVLIRVWPSPPIAASVRRLLEESFPEYPLQVIDIVPRLKRKPQLLALNLLATLREYGLRTLLDRSRLRVAFFGTPFLFRAVRADLRSQLEPLRPQLAFTFQLQSLFDASLPGVPHFVYTDHTMLENLNYPDYPLGASPRGGPGMLYSPRWIELERTIYHNASRLFTRSQNISRSLVEEYGCPPEKVACVYAGSNARIVPGEPDNENYGNRRILFVGADWERKGGPTLVQAFLQVAESDPRPRLTIVGCSPQGLSPRGSPAPGWGDFPQPGLPQIEVVGPVPVQEIHRYYCQASIFCLPTRLEPFGVAFVEALSYRLPIVTTGVGATADFVLEGENGYLVPPGDVGRLAEALRKLLDDPGRCRAFGERSYQLAQERYNWASVGRRLRQEILGVLG